MANNKKSENKNSAECKKEFIKVFNSFSGKYDKHTIWSDFVSMTAITLSNVFDKRFWSEREERFLKIREKYDEADYDKFCQMLSLTVLALNDNTEQDFLGTLYGELKLYNAKNNEYFTPYHVAVLTSVLACTDWKKVDTPISIADDCCGAGCMLIASANMLKNNNINYQREAVFYAQDINMTVALMCYIQLSLLGMQAVIKIGDTLADPFKSGEEFTKENHWITPMSYNEVRACFSADKIISVKEWYLFLCSVISKKYDLKKTIELIA